MRVSTLTTFALAAVVSSAAGKRTLLKSSSGDFFVGNDYADDHEGSGILRFYENSRNENTVSFSLSNDTTLSYALHGYEAYPVSSMYLDLLLGGGVPDGPDNLSSEIWGDELGDREAKTAKGYSWGENGKLECSNSAFHGWVHCQGGDYTHNNSTSFYWASQPIEKLPKECTQVELFKIEV
ncbi:uncharacterized protein TRUGW13939_05965 [Talaromyces rugulosus]|jgi:hypothetical protein|uniref:Uncharacterized protein n=1 Tax=Talaromyces rugulosus TaxID=121627 RepID=A0A7H8QXZ5_TALRU|nr:uncharacterized protein TRUGW13939_05965 [Talaromyces rugulosus]QKX58837.1 hypothetical protein TRUGW13939_05965 [Talaromyces rugulosus]